ncbi:type II secretion system protein [Nocardioides sp. GY 10113]|uniref:type II secretion system F family protein n=1 Tax=Nocardioides sp. GY 10113 TaxID=2569761 RepID=UPI0010A81C42|nr:type II secretion system F family protein [Nocardioides sp. GY 10113]TIC85089.1 type II secretion system protein [Nocardioides sp. GY 10113]
MTARARRRDAVAGAAALVTALVTALGMVAAPSPRLVVLAALALGVGVAGERWWRGRVARASAGATRAAVVELCEALRGELAGGAVPADALERVAEEWPLLAPAARAAAAGGSVAEALRGLAERPGAADLRVVAAAWQVAQRTGHGLGDALGRVAEDLRAAEQTRRVVAGELASARATARLVGGLPLVALAVGGAGGADPWGFLLGTTPGLLCLAAGLGSGLAGLAWIEAIASDVERGR